MPTPDQSDRIRSYNLFGETAEIPDVVHCETVQERSRLHNWEFRPHRHARLHQVLLITEGSGLADIEDRQIPMTPDMVINVPRGHVHGFCFREDTKGWVVTLSSDLVDECLHEGEGLGAMLNTAGATALTPDLCALARQIFDEYGRRSFGRAHVLRSMAGLLIGLVARALQAGHGEPDPGRDNPLFRRFEALVETEYASRMTVSGYADQLAVSPTHLNRIVRQATGSSASSLITARMLREARRLLIYTTLTAAEIGYALGFSDPAHFSRVFARGTGDPPRRFRERMERRDRG